MLVEVLSPTTEDYDRGEKLPQYKQIESLEAILFVAYDEQRLELWSRAGGRWTLEVVRGEGSLKIPSLGCELPVPEVYLDPLAPT